MTIIATNAPAELLHPLMRSDCWISEDQVIANPLMVAKLGATGRKTYATLVSSLGEEPAEEYVHDLLVTLQDLGFHGFVSVS